jgi:hypothetical protein
MSVEPDVLFYVSILFAVVGVAEFILGVWLLSQADKNKKFPGSVIQGSGLGFMAGAAILHFAAGHDWVLIAGLAAVGVGSTTGALSGVRYLKVRGETLQ